MEGSGNGVASVIPVDSARAEASAGGSVANSTGETGSGAMDCSFESDVSWTEGVAFGDHQKLRDEAAEAKRVCRGRGNLFR